VIVHRPERDPADRGRHREYCRCAGGWH